jgi:hypothetical protein
MKIRLRSPATRRAAVEPALVCFPTDRFLHPTDNLARPSSGLNMVRACRSLIGAALAAFL